MEVLRFFFLPTSCYCSNARALCNGDKGKTCLKPDCESYMVEFIPRTMRSILKSVGGIMRMSLWRN